MTKQTSNLTLLFASLALLSVIVNQSWLTSAETIQLTSLLPKLQAIHDDAQALLKSNQEMKEKILVGLQKQVEAKAKLAKEHNSGQTGQPVMVSPPQVTAGSQPITMPPQLGVKPVVHMPNAGSAEIDFSELEDFNKWVEVNLEYAELNTQASIEALKEEARTNNGVVEYCEHAVNDGIEGIKYWQQAVIFQDKTLKNEKFEISE